MSGLSTARFPESRTLLFVGGPNDGHVISGQDAWFMTVTIGPTKADGSANVEGVKLGDRFQVMPSRLMQAMQLLGMDNALIFFERYGVGKEQHTKSVYELSEMLDGLYVYRFVP